MVNSIKSIFHRLVNARAYRFMTCDDESFRREPPERFAGLWLDLMVGVSIWAIASAWLWASAWKIFGDRGNSMLIMASVITVSALLMGPFRRGAVALVEIPFGKNDTLRAMSVTMLAIVLVMSFLRLKADWYRFECDLPGAIGWARPGCKIYRVLIVMPLWGLWSMLIACRFCKPTERTEPAMRTFARTCGLGVICSSMAATLILTIGYFGYLGLGGQLTIPAVSITAAIVGPVILCKFSGGLNRRAILAGNLAAQIAFLLTYLAFQ